MEGRIVKLDGTFEEETRRIEEFLGLEPGQPFSEAVIPGDETGE